MNKYFKICLLVLLTSCNTKQEKNKSERWLEDISFDQKLDKDDFVICNGEENIMQYFNLGDNIEIEGDKPYILQHFQNGLEDKKIYEESGLIRIRFIVNCDGDTDRFRVLESDLNYQPKKFHKSTIKQLLNLTRSLKGWKQKFKDDKPIDYYQYLIFRIEQGEIVKILP